MWLTPGITRVVARTFEFWPKTRARIRFLNWKSAFSMNNGTILWLNGSVRAKILSSELFIIFIKTGFGVRPPYWVNIWGYRGHWLESQNGKISKLVKNKFWHLKKFKHRRYTKKSNIWKIIFLTFWMSLWVQTSQIYF